MTLFRNRFFMSSCILLLTACGCGQRIGPADYWLSDPDAGILFRRQEGGPEFSAGAGSGTVIRIDTAGKFQEVDGFGWALTGGSAQHIIRMESGGRAKLLHDLFATGDSAIGGSYVRLSIGASDLNEKVFSYNDLPAGETDTALLRFDLGPDKSDVIPVMKEILAINPAIKVMGSPWSPPVWMKDNNDTRGGSLRPEYYDVYARYFVKYIREMAKQGIRIDAVTVQNEPLHPGNNPSLLMPAEQQLEFVRDHLGPVFKKDGISTKIILYDHNCDKPEYPISILDDPEAKKYIDGSAFHLYAGDITALSKVHDAHPDRNLYFTEQWVGAPGDMPRDLREHTRNLMIGAMRNWSKTVIEWNLAADPASNPHTDRGGCDRCLGAVTIDKNNYTRNPAYYTIAHLSRFVRPGSKRIESTATKELPNVAFKTPDGKIVLLVMNDTSKETEFSIEINQTHTQQKLRAGSIATYIF
ncbi:MAG: glucosylceramidase [Chitinophagaceae bacterium]|nr:MAG: glucosylceramidase [Chitinophagaceae bacterium]